MAVEQAELEQLSASIAEHGVLQPILVTTITGGYRLIAGERRLRAAEMAGLDRISRRWCAAPMRCRSSPWR